MPHRVVSMFLAVVLCVVALPPKGRAATAEPARKPAQRQIVMEQPPPDDGNPYTEEYWRSYWTSGQSVRAYAYSVETDTYYVPTSDGGWEEQMDYFYNDGQMDSSTTGSNLGYVVYELDRPYNVSLAHITFNGVTATADLYNEQMHPLSEEQKAAIGAWAASGEAALALEAVSAHLGNRTGYEDPAPLTSLDFLALALEPGQDGASGRRRTLPRRDDRDGLVAKLVKAEWSPVAGFVEPCKTPLGTDGYMVMNASYGARPSAQCFGCCGPGCRCINDRQGRPIYASVCAAHDSCVRNSGGAIIGTMWNPACGALFAASAVEVVIRRLPSISIRRRS